MSEANKPAAATGSPFFFHPPVSFLPRVPNRLVTFKLINAPLHAIISRQSKMSQKMLFSRFSLPPAFLRLPVVLSAP